MDLESVTCVGMRFYDSARVVAWIQRCDNEVEPNARTCYFLVPEPTNPYDKNAIMLHDGIRCLGHVRAAETKYVRAVLGKYPDKVVCVVPDYYDGYIGDGWCRNNSLVSLNVAGFCLADERASRKYRDAISKGKE